MTKAATALAIALAETTHHSSRGQTIARAGVWGREMNYTATIRDPLLPTPQPERFSLEEEPGGARPDRMPSLSRPQEWVQRRTVQQIVDPVLLVPTLDDRAPQMVEQLPDILHFLRALSPDPERVSKCPRSCPWTSLCELHEVPTIVSFSSLQRIAEQNVDIPVVGGNGTGGGLSGFLPEQNYSMTAEQIVDNPVPRQCYWRSTRFSARTEFVEADCEQDR